MDVQIYIPRTVLLAHRFVHKTRPDLDRIHIERSGSTLHAVATDGLRLLQVTWPVGEHDTLRDGETLALCPDAAKAASKAHKAVYRYYEGALVDDAGGRIPSPAPEEGEFPPQWRKVLGELGVKAEEYGLDIALLADFGGYLKDARKGLPKPKHGGETQVKCFAGGALSPLRYVPLLELDEKVEFVLMSCRV